MQFTAWFYQTCLNKFKKAPESYIKECSSKCSIDQMPLCCEYAQGFECFISAFHIMFLLLNKRSYSNMQTLQCLVYSLTHHEVNIVKMYLSIAQEMCVNKYM